VFLFTFTSFGVVLILGGYQYATLEVEIYRQAVTLFDVPLAAALAVVQMVGVSAALYFYSRYQERRAATWTLDSRASLPLPAGRMSWIVATAAWVTIAILAVPILALVVRSGGFYRSLLGDDAVVGSTAMAVGNSLLFAVIATVLATVIGLMAASVITSRGGRLSNWFDMTLMLPLGTSAVTIGFGFIVALGWPVDLRASFWLIPIAHALVAIPFVVRTTVPTLRSIPEDVRESASLLGASPGRVWREIDLPIVGRAAAVGAGFALVVSLGEFGATSFIARPNTLTIPTMIFRLLGRPGETSFGTAMALAVILAVLVTVVVFWIDRAQVGDVGRF
jgi:thiamine transport system permease protein